MCIYSINIYCVNIYDMMPGPVVETRDTGRFQNWVIGI